MKNSNTPEGLNWKLIENWGISRHQDLMLVDRMSIEILASNVESLPATRLKGRMKILMEVKARLIAEWDSGQKEL